MQLLEVLKYKGPGRRAQCTVLELLLQFEPGETQGFMAYGESEIESLLKRSSRAGADLNPERLLFREERSKSPEQAAHCFGHLLAETAVALQRDAGHRVDFTDVIATSAPDQYRVVFEYEHGDTGIDAFRLAIALMSECLPGLQWNPDESVDPGEFQQALDAFRREAAVRVLPLETQAMIDAAARLDIPCVKLEREPYRGLEGQFRIRRNGLLKLGHCCHQHVLDGSLCIDRNAELVPLLFDREKLLLRMQLLKLPIPAQDQEFRNLITARRAVRSAERLGYPVVLKPRSRVRNQTVSNRFVFKALHNASEVRHAFEQAYVAGDQVMVEKYIPGDSYFVLMSNHQVICAVPADPANSLPVEFHPSILEMCRRASGALDSGLLAINLVTTDPARTLEETGGAVVDIDTAPQLDRLLAQDQQLMARAAEGFLRWLYPAGSPSRVPLVAVTGTNGKTTTSRMIAHIMQTAGFSTGLACTSGVYINQSLQDAGDMAGSGGHHLVLESRLPNAAVLETARGGVATSGFMFDWCDVAVCVNVSRDHIGQYGIDTLEEMTALKRSVLERARHAVVVNADYTSCAGMLPFSDGIAVWLASIEQGYESLRQRFGKSVRLGVVEQNQGSDWLVLYTEANERLPVLPVAGIPAAVQGKAGFNISNALHAACAARALGIRIEHVKTALSRFDTSFETNPGRFNIYRGRQFTVILDYAHNPDSMKQMFAIVDQMDVSGRRILAYSVSAKRSDEDIAKYARIAAGHFDLYVCRNYRNTHHRGVDGVPNLMKQSLMDAGIGEDRIILAFEPMGGVQEALGLAQPGDLVVICPGSQEMTRIWQEIEAFGA